MLEAISAVLFLFGLSGMAVVFLSKRQAISDLGESGGEAPKENFLIRIKLALKNVRLAKGLSSGIFLQKILSKIRVTTIRIESKTANLLENLREKSKSKNDAEKPDGYWQELKTTKEKESKDKNK